MSAGWPAGKGLGGEGSLASASEPSVVRTRGDGVRGSSVSLGDESFASTRRPAGNGLGGEGSLASAWEPSVVRRRGDGMRCSMISLRGGFLSSPRRPRGNGRGGEGLAATSSLSVGKRDSGSLSSSRFPPSSEYPGEGLGDAVSMTAVIVSTSLCGSEGSLCSSGGEAFSTSTIRPAGKGRGGEGS